jgi:hypothetical protein
MIGLLREGVAVRRDGRLYAAIPNIEVYVQAGAWERSFHQLTAYFAACRLAAGSGIAGPSRSVPTRRPPPRNRGRWRRVVIVAEVDDRYRVRQRSPTGYNFTALSALAIAERAIAGDIRTGF